MKRDKIVHISRKAELISKLNKIPFIVNDLEVFFILQDKIFEQKKVEEDAS